jgi:hypothetical protein
MPGSKIISLFQSPQGIIKGGEVKLQQVFYDRQPPALRQPLVFAGNRIIQASPNDSFAQLDNLWGVDINGMRVVFDGEAPPFKTDGIRLNHINPTGITQGMNGAFLGFTNVAIPAGAKLCFRWSMLFWAQTYQVALGRNDFVLFEMFTPDATSPGKIRRVVANPAFAGNFSASTLLQAVNENVLWTDWRTAKVSTPGNKPFFGSIRWIISNGEFLTRPGQPLSNAINAWPSSLLIDAAWVE